MGYERIKMPIERRAKIFLPFAGVRGLEEALEKKREERLREERIILSEDGEAEINLTLTQIDKGDSITILYYDNDRYRTYEGKVIKKDIKEGLLILDNGALTRFEDIRSIRKNITPSE